MSNISHYIRLKNVVTATWKKIGKICRHADVCVFFYLIGLGFILFMLLHAFYLILEIDNIVKCSTN